MITTRDVDLDTLATSLGWSIKPQGACQGDRCLPLGAEPSVATLLDRLGAATVVDEETGAMAVGPESGGTTLTSTELPDVVLEDRHGAPVNLRSFIGRRLVLTSWAPWCGCRMDLPVWKELRGELIASGIEVVTVALDNTGDSPGLLEAVDPDHPALIDRRHQLVGALGFVNVPMAVWVQEDGRIVRPAEPAWPGRSVYWEDGTGAALAEAAGVQRVGWVGEMFDEANRIVTRPDDYVEGLRDWARHGASSRYVLEEHEVLDRSGTRTLDQSRAAAHFELGTHLRELGRVDDARTHWRAAHALDPDNWSFKRQAWYTEDPLQQPTEHYESDFVSDIRRRGPENYYTSGAGITDSARDGNDGPA